MESIYSTEEWKNLAEYWPPVVTRSDGSLLVITGKWSDSKRTYDYSSLEVAGLKPSAVGPEVARLIQTAQGPRVAEYRADADPEFDGTRYRSATPMSRLTVWWVAASVPVRIQSGQTSMSSGGIPHGTSKVYFFGGPESAPAYRSASQKFTAAHASAVALPQPPTPRQTEILEKYHLRHGPTYAVPATRDGASRILDVLASNDWKFWEAAGTWQDVLQREKIPAPPAPRR